MFIKFNIQKYFVAQEMLMLGYWWTKTSQEYVLQKVSMDV